jgi:hypothetical protein
MEFSGAAPGGGGIICGSHWMTLYAYEARCEIILLDTGVYMKWSSAAALSLSMLRVEPVEDAAECCICDSMFCCDVIMRIQGVCGSSGQFVSLHEQSTARR